MILQSRKLLLKNYVIHFPYLYLSGQASCALKALGYGTSKKMFSLGGIKINDSKVLKQCSNEISSSR